MCQTLTSARACYLQTAVERKKSDPAFTEAGVMDIEDLIKVCGKLRVCPYYMSRELKQQADIIFMPYNYLLDPRTRRQQDVDIAVSALKFCSYLFFALFLYVFFWHLLKFSLRIALLFWMRDTMWKKSVRNQLLSVFPTLIWPCASVKLPR